jgi:hypothetical protein
MCLYLGIGEIPFDNGFIFMLCLFSVIGLEHTRHDRRDRDRETAGLRTFGEMSVYEQAGTFPAREEVE